MSTFHFKHFSIKQDDSAMKVGTDAMLLGSFVDVKLKKHALDLGAGTGVLSCMMAQQNSNLYIDAIEIEDNAYNELVYNVRNASFSHQIFPIHGDILEYKTNSLYDLIISNPPYFEDTFLSECNERNVARHVMGLTPSKLLSISNELLTDKGTLWVIIPAKYFVEWVNIAEQIGLYLTVEIQVMGVPGRHVRSILCFSKQIYPLIREVFTVRNEDGNYTRAYINKTLEFHSKVPIR